MLDILYAAIIGIIQGITEWLPVSSTGHIILANEFIQLRVSEEFWKMFEVVIQLGSILAVLCLYFHKLNPVSPKKSVVEKKQTINLWLKVIVGVIPAAVVGLLLDDWIPEHPIVIAVALIVYGVIFILLERRKVSPKITKLEDLNYITALKIGTFQVLSLIPGTSRSGSTILGGIISGTSREVAAEFSFFLAVPVMFGASLLRVVKFLLEGITLSSIEIWVLITGVVVAFLVSVFAIKFLMGYIRKHDFTAFGYYRIVLGIIVILYFGIKWII